MNIYMYICARYVYIYQTMKVRWIEKSLRLRYRIKCKKKIILSLCKNLFVYGSYTIIFMPFQCRYKLKQMIDLFLYVEKFVPGKLFSLIRMIDEFSYKNSAIFWTSLFGKMLKLWWRFTVQNAIKDLIQMASQCLKNFDILNSNWGILVTSISY